MDHARRIARQHVQTDRLLGMDAVPVPPRVTRPPDSPVSPESSKAAAPEIVVTAGPSAGLFVPSGEPVAAATAQEKAAALAALLERHDRECPQCTAATSHTRTVFGEGDPAAALMFVGEAPGEEEDRTGRPFVGRAGKKLDEMITAMGLSREQVYIANILKSRPPDNRTPLPAEVEGCSPYLAHQIRIILPTVLVALGGPAAKWMLRTNVGITRLRGSWATYADGSICIPVMPTFHPAYLLRNYTIDTRRRVWADMQSVVQRLGNQTNLT